MWSQKSTLALIEDIRLHPCLWDTKCEDYKKRVKRVQAYGILGVKYGVNAKEIELKFQALKNQFRREHRRLEKHEAGLSPKQIHWFGYEPLMYLLNHSVKPNPEKNEQDVNATQQLIETSDTEYTEYLEYETIEETEPITTTPIKLAKVQNNEGTTTASEAFKCMRTIAEKVCSRDEFDIYGEYIAHKLRECGRPRKEIAIAQHVISTTCFKLCMGEFVQNKDPLQGSIHTKLEDLHELPIISKRE